MRFQTSIKQLRSLIRNVLIEGKVEDLQKKHPNLNVERIALQDLSSTQKYLTWMCKQLDKGVNENDLFPTIKLFHKNVQQLKKRDINQYATFKELEDAIKTLLMKPMSKSEMSRNAKDTGAERLFENDDLILVRTDSKQACQVYGANTKWCITMKDGNYYEHYKQHDVVFYFVLSKTLPTDDKYAKTAIVVMRIGAKIMELEFFDALDNSLSQAQFESIVPNGQSVLRLALNDAKQQPEGLLFKVSNGEATEAELEDALTARTTTRDTKKFIVQNNVPAKTLLLLAQDKDPSIRGLVAINSNVSEEISKLLANDPETSVRMSVANSSRTSSNVLSTLATDHDPSVRQAVANNRKSQSDVLNLLASDDNERVRDRVAWNDHTDPNALTLLSRDEKQHVRVGVASNKSTPKNVLRLLLNDEDDYVKNVANRNLKGLTIW